MSKHKSETQGSTTDDDSDSKNSTDTVLGHGANTSKIYTQANIKVQPFSTRNPDLWFLQVESHFTAQRLTSDAIKFHTVVSQLPEDIAITVIDLLRNPPEQDKYKTLKNRLVNNYLESDQTRVRKLLSKITLGDRKPSTVLNQMQQHNVNNQVGQEVIKALWLDCLPETAKAILSVSTDSLQQLAVMADKIIETTQLNVMAFHSSTRSTGHNNSSLEDKIDNIISRIDKLERPSRSSSHFRSSSKYRGRTPTPNRSKSKTKFDQCFFHHKFGDKARSCRKWSEEIQIDDKSYRLFLLDPITKIKFLIDTGADLSIITNDHRNEKGIRVLPINLFAANGSRITTHGVSNKTVSLGLRRQFSWNFVIADVTTSILGADFLSTFNLVVNLKQKCLIDPKTQVKSICQLTKSPSTYITFIDSNCQFSSILKDFKCLVDEQPCVTPIKANITHHIVTNGPPVTSKPRRLTPEKYEAAKREFEELLSQGICRPSKSNWSSPLHMVHKPNGEWRPCGDYRRLNSVTIPDKYPVPHIQDFVINLQDKKIFSVIDLRKAFHQVLVEECDIPKTAITTPFGLYEFTRMTFGLSNAAQTFQRLIDEVFRGVDYVIAYIDDIFVASEDEEQHKLHLREVFSRLAQHGLKINQAKCKYGKYELEFLGHLVTANGIKPLQTKVEAIMNFPKPKIAKELRRFIAMTNFYRRFIPKAIVVQDKLQKLIKGNIKNDKSLLVWTDEASTAFEECKQLLAKVTTLAHPIKDAKLTLNVDASDLAMGAALHQLKDDQLQPLAFFSRKFTEPQKKYSTYDRELTAIYEAIKYFKCHLEGRQFTIYTDHKPIIFAFRQKAEKASPRQCRQLDFISQFSTDIKYIKGADNIVPDLLSRIEEITAVDYTKLAEKQKDDEELKQWLQKKDTSLILKSLKLEQSDRKIYCDVSTNFVRPFVPQSFRNTIIRKFHELAHPGNKATLKLVQERFVWPNLKKDVTNFVRACIPCQRVKINKHIRAPIQKYPVTSSRFDHVNIDIVGPLPSSHGYQYILTAIDRFSRWPEAIPIPDITAETIARHLIWGWVARFGVPLRITTDRGRQFESQLFLQLNNMLGSKHLRTTSYHPQSNGIIERWHRTLKAALKAKLTHNWFDELPLVLLGLRSCFKLDLNSTPAEMVMGTTLRLPGEFFSNTKPAISEHEFINQLRKTFDSIKPTETSDHSKQHVFIQKSLNESSHVFIRNDTVRTPLQPVYDGPYEVLNKNNKFFTLKIKGKQNTVSIDRLKPAFIVPEKDIEMETLQTKSKHTPEIKTRSGRSVRFPDRLSY